MVGSSQYPEERQTRRVLELSFPEVDADVRENFAYLVSVRRMTLDEALNELEEADKKAQTSKNAAAASGARQTTTAGKAQTSSPTSNGRYTATTTATAARSDGGSESLAPTTTTTTTTEAYTQRYANRRRATGTAETATAPPPRRTSGSSDGGSHDGSGGDFRRGEAAQCTGTTVVLPPATPARSTAASVPRRSATDTSRTAATRPVLPPTCASPTRGNTTTTTTTAESGRGRPGQYSSSKRTGARVSRSDSELTEMREAARSLVRSEEESHQSSAPDVLSGRGSAAEMMPTQRRSGPSPATAALTTAALGATRASRQAEEDEVETVAPVRPAESRRSNWTRPTDEKPGPSEGGEAAGEEPMFTDTKLVTDDEKAVYEERMKDMMHYWYRDETSMYDYTLRSLPVGQVLFFTTSMTGERRVRDHCRLMENLLYLKLIPHHTIDVADSEFFLRRVRKMYTHATKLRTTPEMPLLFVDDTLIGDFTTVQELEDAGELDAKMLSAGCSVLRPRVVAECEAKLAGLPGAPLVLPTNPSKTTRAKASKASISSGGASPPLAKPRSTAPPAPTPAVAVSGPRGAGGDVNGEERLEGATRSPTKRVEAAKAVSAVTARPPPSSSRVPSTATTTTAGSALAQKGAAAGAAVHDHPTAVEAPASSSGCRFSNGRRLGRTSHMPTSNDSPALETHKASTKAVSTPADEEVSNPSSVGRTMRTSARAPLVKSGAQGRTSTTENAERRPPTSTVPRLPSLSSRNAESRDEELTSPLSNSASHRRHGASSRRSSAAAAVASRVGLC